MVVVLGIAIVVMLGIIVVTAINRMTGAVGESETATTEPAPASAPADGHAWRSGLDIAPGERLISITMDGGRVLAVVGGDDGPRRAIVLDAESGRQLGVVVAE